MRYQSTDLDLVAAEMKLLRKIALGADLSLSLTVQQNDDCPDHYREILTSIGEWNGLGANVKI